MDTRSGRVNRLIAQIASRQHGLATRRQLLAAGLTSEQIAGRVRGDLLIRVHPGVYRVGHSAPSALASYLAAVLAGGDRAFIIERPAAWLHSLVPGVPPPPAIASPSGRVVRDVRCRNTRSFDERDITVVHGIRVSSVAGALVDLAGILSLSDLSRACHEAQVRYRTTPAQVADVMARRPTAKGAANLRRVIEGDAPVTLSRLESRFLVRLRAAGLPLPKTNVVASGRYVDCRFEEHALTVELDSYRFHNSRLSWQRGHAREREAYARGDQFRRYTYADVFESPAAMLRELRALLT